LFVVVIAIIESMRYIPNDPPQPPFLRGEPEQSKPPFLRGEPEQSKSPFLRGI
jgi:hypothetical protein